MTRPALFVGALALVCFASPALADVAAAVPAAPTNAITLAYGSWITEYGATVAYWAISAFFTFAIPLVGTYVPWLKSVATQQRLEMAAHALAQYAVNAVPGSVKEGKVTINAGSAVVATAVQRGIDVLPGKVLKAADKGGGLAAIVFRVLDLEEGASKANVLDPAVSKLRADGIKA